MNATRQQPRPPEQIEVGELRERLRALGYLNAGVDRFVLAPADGELGAFAVAWRVSLRIGVLAALLLGPAAAIGLAVRLPGLIVGVRDAIVTAGYLAVIFGAGATLLSLVAAMAVRSFARQASAPTARRLAFGAGIAVSLACLAYLTLWWNAASLGAAWTAPGRTLVAIAAAVGISLLLGHAVTVAALALLTRESPRSSLMAPATSWRATAILGAIAFAAVAGLLATSVLRGEDGAAQVPDFAVVPTGVRVLLVGIDGFDPALFDTLSQDASRGALTTLRGTRLTVTSPGDPDPARVWTTIATGVGPDQHGVTGLELRRIAGLEGAVERRGQSTLARSIAAATDLLQLTRPAPASGMTRRHKMLWEVAADKGLNAAVINWWATWPATNTRATVVSDRAPIRLERGGEQSAEIAPASLYSPLRAKWPSIAARARELASTLDAPQDSVGELLERSAVLDAEQVLLARDPLLGAPDLLAVYLPGLDIAQHTLLNETGTSLSPSEVAARLQALRGYYRFLDRLMSELLDGVANDTLVVTVTHPGRVRGDAKPTVAFHGGPVKPTPWRVSGDVSLADVQPTACYLLGLPVSRQAEGQPLLFMLDEEFVQRHPLRFVDTYGRYTPDVPASAAAPLDKEMLERLRSLGYIK